MQPLIAIALFCLGAVFASFITVIAERMHTGQSWLAGRSRCNSCRRKLTALDLLPVFSWIFSKGKCRTCKSRVPGQYALTEALLGTAFVLAYIQLQLSLELLVFLAATIVLLLIVLYDLRHTIVPLTPMILFVVLTGLLAVLQSDSVSSLVSVVSMAAIIGLAFLALHFLSKGRAMGLGDAPIAFGAALLTPHNALSGLIFSFWIGAAYGITLLVLRTRGTTMHSEVPFVPFLAAGFLLAFFTGWNILPL